MAATLVDQCWMNGMHLEVWDVTLEGQTEVTVLTHLGEVVWWDTPIKQPATGEVPFYEGYVRKTSTGRTGSIEVWCSDTSVTDKVFVKVYGHK